MNPKKGALAAAEAAFYRRAGIAVARAHLRPAGQTLRVPHWVVRRRMRRILGDKLFHQYFLDTTNGEWKY